MAPLLSVLSLALCHEASVGGGNNLFATNDMFTYIRYVVLIHVYLHVSWVQMHSKLMLQKCVIFNKAINMHSRGPTEQYFYVWESRCGCCL